MATAKTALDPEAVDQFHRNLKRVRNLLQMYQSFVDTGVGRQPIEISDLLRAATVFLHASLEDLLRAVASAYLPKANSKALEPIPLTGHTTPGTKHTLADLSLHRSKTVDEVIRQSVLEHLENKSYSNPSELAALLRSIGCDVNRVNEFFPTLERMISRRHHIVHQADRNEAKGSGHHRTRSISLRAVEDWLSVVTEFGEKLVSSLETSTTS